MSQIKGPSSITVQHLVNTLRDGDERRKRRYLTKKKSKGSKQHKPNKPKENMN